MDAGISCRETERRMSRLGLSLKNVKAIFISHEHSDHINGLRVLSRKHKLPVYITEKTLFFSGLELEPELVRVFKVNETVRIGNFAIHSFSKTHDAADPCSFVVSASDIHIGVITDIGHVCKNVIHYFKQCHATFLETNYDEEMLQNGRYPHMLKNRIRGGRGHISNSEALDLFIKHKPTHLSHLFLSHLSADNNNPDLVHELFLRHAHETEIIVASRYTETLLYQIHGGQKTSLCIPEQLSLFDSL